MNGIGQDRNTAILLIPRATVQAVVRGKPFQSRFISTRLTANGTAEKLSGEMYRDSNGDLSLVQRHRDGEETTTISDVVGKKLIFVDRRSRTVQIHNLDNSGAPNGWIFSDCVPAFTDERTNIQGIKTRRIMLHHPSQREIAVGEIWLSDDLSIVMKDSGTVDGVSRDWHITELHLTEPDPALFQCPSGYQTIELDER